MFVCCAMLHLRILRYSVALCCAYNNQESGVHVVAHTLGPQYALGTLFPRDTGVVRGEALRDAPVSGLCRASTT